MGSAWGAHPSPGRSLVPLTCLCLLACVSALTMSLRWVTWALPGELTPALAQSLPCPPWPHLHPSCLPAGGDPWCLHPRSAPSLGAVPHPQRVLLGSSPQVSFPLSMQASCVSSHLGQKAATLSPRVSLLLQPDSFEELAGFSISVSFAGCLLATEMCFTNHKAHF